MKVLVAFDMIREGWDELISLYDVTFPPAGRDFTQEELLNLIPDYDILCSVFDIPIRKDIIAAGKHLKLIANFAVGYNNIDIAFAKSQGIAVTNTPKSVVEPTADLAMALLLDVSRNIYLWGKDMHRDKHKLEMGRIKRLGIGIQNKTLGIIGMGNIGKAFAKRAQACGMKIWYNKRSRYDNETEEKLGFKYASIDEILKGADFISLHTPYSEETHHLIDAEALNKMKPNAILINTGRGALIDESALIEALKANKIAGAALDVFENKDLPTPELYELENVSMTPHIGTQTYEARMDMLNEMINYIIGYFNGDRTISRVV